MQVYAFTSCSTEAICSPGFWTLRILREVWNPRKLLYGYDHVSQASLTSKTKIRGLIPEKAYDVNCGNFHSVLVRVSLACVFVHLAGAQDLEHEWEAVCYEFLCVLLLFNRAELFQQTLDQRPPVLQETGSQGLQPSVQRPGHTWYTQKHMTNTVLLFNK